MLSAALTWGALPNPFNYAEIVAFVQSLGINITGTISNSDIGAGAVTTTKVTPGPYAYAQAGHSGSMVFTLTITPALTALTDGAEIWGRMPVAIDASGSPTLNVSGLGAKKWLRRDGSALRVGELRTGQSFHCIYNSSMDGSVGAWVLLSTDSAQFQDGYQSAVTTGTNDYVATFAPVVPSLVDGTRVRFKVPNTNTGVCTFKADAQTAKAIKKQYNVPLAAGDLPAGFHAELVYCGTNDWWHLQVLTATALKDNPVIGSARNLLIKNNAGAPTIKVDLTADEIVLKNSDVASYLARTVAVSVDITVNAANGLDAGAEANSTWYYVYCIYNPTTLTVAGLLSTSATAPTLPAGYTFSALVGMVYNDSGGNFDTVYIEDRTYYTDDVNLFAGQAPTVAGTYQSVSLAAFVAPLARSVFGTGGVDGAAVCRFSVAGDANGLGAVNIVGTNSTVHFGFTCGGRFDVPIRTSQTIYWTSSTAATANNRLNLSGFRF